MDEKYHKIDYFLYLNAAEISIKLKMLMVRIQYQGYTKNELITWSGCEPNPAISSILKSNAVQQGNISTARR